MNLQMFFSLSILTLSPFPSTSTHTNYGNKKGGHEHLRNISEVGFGIIGCEGTVQASALCAVRITPFSKLRGVGACMVVCVSN